MITSIFTYPQTLEDVTGINNFKEHKRWYLVDLKKQRIGNLSVLDDTLKLEFKVAKNTVNDFKYCNEITTTDGKYSRCSLFYSPIYEEIFGFMRHSSEKVSVHASPRMLIYQANSNKPISTNILHISGRLPGMWNFFGAKVLDFDNKKMQFNKPEMASLNLELSKGINVYLNIGIRRNLRADDNTVFEPDSYVDICYEEPRHIDVALRLFTQIENFFNFIFPTVHSCHLFRVDDWENKPRKNAHLDILIPSKYVKTPRKEYSYSDGNPLFQHTSIENTAQALYNWLVNYNKFREATDTLTLIKTTHIKGDIRFTLLLNALESLHRRIYDRPRIPENQYEEMKERILSNSDPQDKEYLELKLHHGNELTLRQRLNEIYDICKSYDLLKLGTVKRNKVIDSRNYLVHRDANLKPKLMNEYEFEEVNSYLTKCLKILVLIEMDLGKGVIKKIVKDSAQFKAYYSDTPHLLDI